MTILKTIMKIFSICGSVFIVGFMTAQLIGCISYRKKLMQHEDKIKLKNPDITYLIIWAIISLTNIPTALQQFPDSAAYILLLFLTELEFLVFFITSRYCYVTGEEFIRNDILNKHTLKKEKIRYKADGDTLMIYYGKRVNPMKFRIIEQKNELAAILTENYRQYERKEEQP